MSDLPPRSPATSSRRKKVASAAADQPVVDPETGVEPGSTQDWCRRVLLTGAVALLVARPVVPGEDPGLTAPLASPAGLVLTQLWLTLAAGWFCWRLWANVRRWVGGLIELMLLLIVGLMFLSAAQAARYKHPAWLIAWEWLGFLAAFTVVRQLATKTRDLVGLFSALLASGVMLGVAGAWQWLSEGPRLEHQPAATFSSPSTYASFLLLVAPGLLTAVVLSGRGRQWLRFGCLTAGTLAILLPLAACWPSLVESVSRSASAWQNSNAMLEQSSWLGVGPGNFSREYPRYLHPGEVPLPEAPNLFLSVAASAGVVAVVLLVLALVLFFVALRRRAEAAVETNEPPAGNPSEEEEQTKESLPWEFYLGGMLGLLLGLLLRLMGAQPQEIWDEGMRALVRSAVWFGAFAVLEGVPWSGRSLTWASGLGVLALLLHWLAAPGIGYPSLAIPLWVAMALALNSVSASPNLWISPRRVGLALAVPVAVSVPLIYFLAVLSPTTSAAGNINLAVARGKVLLHDRTLDPKDRKLSVPRALNFIHARVLRPLAVAERDDPGNVQIPLLQARWYREMWLVDSLKEYWKKEWGDLALAAQNRVLRARQLDPHGQEPYWSDADLHQGFAGRMMPWSPLRMVLGAPFEAWLATFKATKENDRKTAIQVGRPPPPSLAELEKQARIEWRKSAEACRELAELDPTAPLPRYRAAECLCLAGDREEMLQEARKALELDERNQQVRLSLRHLTDPQREQIRFWLSLRQRR